MSIKIKNFNTEKTFRCARISFNDVGLAVLSNQSFVMHVVSTTAEATVSNSNRSICWIGFLLKLYLFSTVNSFLIVVYYYYLF